jgi:hypothetical protein
MVVLGPACMPADFLRSLKSKADEIAGEVEGALRQRGIPYHLHLNEAEGDARADAHSRSAQVRKTPCRPRSRANFSLL